MVAPTPLKVGWCFRGVHFCALAIPGKTIIARSATASFVILIIIFFSPLGCFLTCELSDHPRPLTAKPGSCGSAKTFSAECRGRYADEEMHGETTRAEALRVS